MEGEDFNKSNDSVKTLIKEERKDERIIRREDRALRKARMLNYVLAAISIVLAVLLFMEVYPKIVASFQPQFGNTIVGIDTPLNPVQLAIINNASNSDFETAGMMLLNGTIENQVQPAMNSNVLTMKPFVVNGKPSVIYIGAISCIYCGENRWAMALALSRFGSFQNLYEGYSALQDGDIPTLYWAVDNYTAPGVSYGNSYTSNYINFLSIEYGSNITGGFSLPESPMAYFLYYTPNATYTAAVSFMNRTNDFKGTPFTFWGVNIYEGVDAVVLGNTTPTTATLPLAYMTHEDVLNSLNRFNDQFAWSEYAAADIYISTVCVSINNAASVCSLPAIREIESREGF